MINDELWKVEEIQPAGDEIYEAIITALDGTKLIANVTEPETANHIAGVHNALVSGDVLHSAAENAAKDAVIEAADEYIFHGKPDSHRKLADALENYKAVTK
jgi:propanediol dehydratase large subunit